MPALQPAQRSFTGLTDMGRGIINGELAAPFHIAHFGGDHHIGAETNMLAEQVLGMAQAIDIGGILKSDAGIKGSV
jgi:hypothetical protein